MRAAVVLGTGRGAAGLAGDHLDARADVGEPAALVVFDIAQALQVQQVHAGRAHRERTPVPGSPVQHKDVVRAQQEGPQQAGCSEVNAVPGGATTTTAGQFSTISACVCV